MWEQRKKTHCMFGSPHTWPGFWGVNCLRFGGRIGVHRRSRSSCSGAGLLLGCSIGLKPLEMRGIIGIFIIHTSPGDPITLSEDDWVSNHLLSIVFGCIWVPLPFSGGDWIPKDPVLSIYLRICLGEMNMMQHEYLISGLYIYIYTLR